MSHDLLDNLRRAANQLPVKSDRMRSVIAKGLVRRICVAAKIARDVLESHLHRKCKGHLRVTAELGVGSGWRGSEMPGQ